jgi:hypothetical protein
MEPNVSPENAAANIYFAVAASGELQSSSVYSPYWRIELPQPVCRTSPSITSVRRRREGAVSMLNTTMSCWALIAGIAETIGGQLAVALGLAAFGGFILANQR